MHLFSRRRSSASNKSPSGLYKSKEEGGNLTPSGTDTDVPGHDHIYASQDDAIGHSDTVTEREQREPAVATAPDPVVVRRPVQDISGDETDVSAQGNPMSTSEAAATTRYRQSSASTASDSGYGSTGSKNARKRSKSAHKTGAATVHAPAAIGEMDDDTDIKPIPVVWSADEEEPRDQEQRPHIATGAVSRSQSRMRTQSPWLGRSGDADNYLRRGATSVRSYRHSDRLGDRDSAFYTASPGRRTPHRSMSIGGGTFAAGPGTVGPNAVGEIDESFESRTQAAEAALGEKEKNKLGKTERGCCYTRLTVIEIDSRERSERRKTSSSSHQGRI